MAQRRESLGQKTMYVYLNLTCATADARDYYILTLLNLPSPRQLGSIPIGIPQCAHARLTMPELS